MASQKYDTHTKGRFFGIRFNAPLIWAFAKNDPEHFETARKGWLMQIDEVIGEIVASVDSPVEPSCEYEWITVDGVLCMQMTCRDASGAIIYQETMCPQGAQAMPPFRPKVPGQLPDDRIVCNWGS